MKRITISTIILILSIKAYSQVWNATNLSTFSYVVVSSIESHNENLYGITIVGASRSLYKLNSDKTSWTEINTSAIGGKPMYVKSTGSRLYVAVLGPTFNSLLYYSEDDGETFVIDTGGLPEYFDGIRLIYGLQYFNEKIVVNFGAEGYYIKDLNDTIWHKIDTTEFLNGGSDPICILNNTLFAYDNSGAFKLYSSVDYGTSWTEVNTNLPSTFGVAELTSDEAKGRLYIAGGKTDQTEYGLYYSDDNGLTWIYNSLTPFLDTDINGAQQEIREIYTNDNRLFLALENNLIDSPVKIISSSNGIENLALDITGLLNDQVGKIYGHTFLEHDGQMVVALSNQDVYIKSSTLGTGDPYSLNQQITLYPIPIDDILTISGLKEKGYSQIIVYSLDGKTIKKENIDNNKINLSGLESGFYTINIKNGMTYYNHKIYKK